MNNRCLLRERGSRSAIPVPAQNKGTLKRWIPLVVRPAINFIDAAIAVVDYAGIHPTLLRGVGPGSDQDLCGLATVRGEEAVFKIGRTSGLARAAGWVQVSWITWL